MLDGTLRPGRLLAVPVVATAFVLVHDLGQLRVLHVVVVVFAVGTRRCSNGRREDLAAGDPERVGEVALRDGDVELEVEELLGVGEVEDHEGDAHHPLCERADQVRHVTLQPRKIMQNKLQHECFFDFNFSINDREKLPFYIYTVRPNKKETRFISEISSLLRKI